jgi:pyrophosphatase PpaX
MQRKYTTALFDMDGTLVTLDAVIRAIQDTFDHYGLKQMPPGEIMRTFIGHRIADVLPRIYPETKNNAREIVDHYVDNFVRNYMKFEELQPYAFEALSQLKREGIQIAIITTRKRPMAESTITDHKIPCDCLITNDDVRNIKPSPEPILKALQKLGADASGAVMVGDHVVDVLSAKAAGCDSIGVLTGVSTRTEFMQAKADHVIPNLGQLPGLMGLK